MVGSGKSSPRGVFLTTFRYGPGARHGRHRRQADVVSPEILKLSGSELVSCARVVRGGRNKRQHNITHPSTSTRRNDTLLFPTSPQPLSTAITL